MVAGEGGDDAKDFAQTLFAAYLAYLNRNGLTAEINDCGPSKWSFVCEDLRAESLFENEAGGHCVQRMPSNGKGHKHTSYVVVMVSRLKVQTAEMRECDLEETTQRGHGKGGQAQNKISTAVRLRHRPTGLEVFINGRDQYSNKKVARLALSGKIDQWLHSQETRDAYAGAGRGQKIRTYNIQDSRITDHRNGVKVHRPEMVLRDGRFDLLR